MVRHGDRHLYRWTYIFTDRRTDRQKLSHEKRDREQFKWVSISSINRYFIGYKFDCAIKMVQTFLNSLITLKFRKDLNPQILSNKASMDRQNYYRQKDNAQISI